MNDDGVRHLEGDPSVPAIRTEIVAFPGNANLPIGAFRQDDPEEDRVGDTKDFDAKPHSTQESSVAFPGNANLPIGAFLQDDPEVDRVGYTKDFDAKTHSTQESSVAFPENANLPIGAFLQDDPKDARGSTRKDSGVETGANREIGVPRGDWRSRRYLPHFEGKGYSQHVTLHLADSLPEEVRLRLEEELVNTLEGSRNAERRKRLEAWMDSGYGWCVLRDASVAAMVQESLLSFDEVRYELMAWVIMPNHVHVLFRPNEGWEVEKIVGSWKKFTARRITDWWKATPRGKAGEGVPGGKVWHREYWDRYIRNEEHFAKVVAYIHENPVKARLVRESAGWRWSSAFLGNANLPIGAFRQDDPEEDRVGYTKDFDAKTHSTQESSVAFPGNTNLLIGAFREDVSEDDRAGSERDSDAETSANQEIGVPREGELNHG